ncbi:MAG: glycosyltransferase [Bacteroidales bacterium]|jgi:glycosyltransferase involved in cell wall biosynthesis|nr:glycosyltransferase [Bacteroidales bacterium]
MNHQIQSFSPKVSVIIPVWNAGMGIRKCVDSLRCQTLEDIEMIFVDDCSTDGAMEVVRQAVAEDSRIRIITNTENVGSGPSRNVGIEVARGEYLSFVDADDYVDSFFLERLYAKAIAGQLDIVKGRFCYVKEDGSEVERYNLNKIIREGIQLGKPLFCLFRYEHQSAIYRRAFVMDNAIRYGTSRRSEDTTFLLKACHRCGRFDIVEESEYFYRKQNDSLVHDASSQTLERKLHAFQERMDYIVEYMADEYYISYYMATKVQYDLEICNYIRKIPEYREAANRFTIDFREQVLRFPRLEELKSESFVARVLCDYGIALSHRPFKLPWEPHNVDNYVETLQEWVDCVKVHPECSNAAEEDLRKLYLEAEALCTKINLHLPCPLVRDVRKICRINMKVTIRNFISRIPLAIPLYHALKFVAEKRLEQKNLMNEKEMK